MDQLGAGTGRLVEECLKLKAKRPVWKVKSGILSLTLFKAPEPMDTDFQLLTRQMEFLKTLKAKQEFKPADYNAAAGVSERQGRRDLMEMESAGLLTRIGKGPATSYQRTERKLP
jgi:ATP-dependent DNA helicase RecG